MKHPVTPRRCKRCGAIQNNVPPSGLCSSCEKWMEKNK